MTFEQIRDAKVKHQQKKDTLKKNFRNSLIEENNFLEDETVDISMDVYNMFIVANITKNCTPI